MDLRKLTDKILLKIWEKLTLRVNNAKKERYVSNPTYSLNIGNDVKFDFNKNAFEILDGAIVNIGDGVIFRDFCNIMVYRNALLTLGAGVFFNRYCSINCLGNISIGEHSIFGEGVRLFDHNHKFGDPNLPVYEQGTKFGEIHIGKNCWIGANTIILNNVNIGDGAIIGANNLIYKDIPPRALIKAKAEKIAETY